MTPFCLFGERWGKMLKFEHYFLFQNLFDLILRVGLEEQLTIAHSYRRMFLSEGQVYWICNPNNRSVCACFFGEWFEDFSHIMSEGSLVVVKKINLVNNDYLMLFFRFPQKFTNFLRQFFIIIFCSLNSGYWGLVKIALYFLEKSNTKRFHVSIGHCIVHEKLEFRRWFFLVIRGSPDTFEDQI